MCGLMSPALPLLPPPLVRLAALVLGEVSLGGVAPLVTSRVVQWEPEGLTPLSAGVGEVVGLM